MRDADATAYVDAACDLAGLPLDAAARGRVAIQFVRLAAVAAPLLAVPLPDDAEPPAVLPP
jgi:hypothetical protein